MVLWLIAVSLALSLVGCGAPSPAPTAFAVATPASPSADRVQTGAIDVDGIRVVPPAWLALDDYQALGDACHEYLDDFRGVFQLWTPEPGAAMRFPLTVCLHDVQGGNLWDESVRTAWLEWPRGSRGRPLRVAFAPLLSMVLMLDRRRELGIVSTDPLTSDEWRAYTNGRALQVRLATRHGGDFD